MRGLRLSNQRFVLGLIPVTLFLGVFLLVALTISDYGVTWDEPWYFHASDLEMNWFANLGRNLLRGNPAESLQDKVIVEAWHWDPLHVPHPPFSRILSGLSKSLLSSFMDKFMAYRLPPALFFALLVTVMYLWMSQLFDRMTGLFSALSLVLMPNLFGFAHFAVTDMPLTALWFLTVYCFWRGLKDWRWSCVLGCVWGLALSTKFPALLIPIPLFLWAHIYHRRFYYNNVFSMAFLSPLVMVITNPYLWHNTPIRFLEFLYEGLARGYRPETNYTIFFLHKHYASSTVPRYYPFFMTAVTVPETILFLSFIGALALWWMKSQRQIIVLFLLNAAFMLVMGLLPGAVLHDVNRLMLPVLPYIAGLAGCGFFFLARCLKELSQRVTILQGIKDLPPKPIGILSLLLLFPAALDLFVYHPFELSYYNRLVGGIRGAYERGLEVTYFMEAFTPRFLDFLNRSLPPNAVVNAAFSNFMFAYYQNENRLRPDIRITDETDAEYLILLTRKSTFEKDAHFLLKNVRPYDALRLDGVPLISIYKVKGLKLEGK